MPGGLQRQRGYTPDEKPTVLPQYGPPAPLPPTRTLGGVDVNRLPFKPSEIDFNDDEEYLNGLRRDVDKVRSVPLLRDGSSLPQPQDVKQHPEYPVYAEKLRRFNEGLANKTLNDPTEIRNLQHYLDGIRKKMETDSRASTKTINEQRKIEMRRNDEQRLQPDARMKFLEHVTPYIENLVSETEQELQTGDPATKRAAEYRKTVSPLTTMARKKPDGTMDYSLLRDTTATLMAINPHLRNPEMVGRAVMAMGTPPGFDDRTGKAIVGANGLRGKGATAYEVLGRDEINPKYVVVRTKDGVTLAVDPYTMKTIEDARILGYNAIRSWEEKEAQKHGKNFIERAIEPFVPRR